MKPDRNRSWTLRILSAQPQVARTVLDRPAQTRGLKLASHERHEMVNEAKRPGHHRSVLREQSARPSTFPDTTGRSPQKSSLSIAPLAQHLQGCGRSISFVALH